MTRWQCAAAENLSRRILPQRRLIRLSVPTQGFARPTRMVASSGVWLVPKGRIPSCSGSKSDDFHVLPEGGKLWRPAVPQLAGRNDGRSHRNRSQSCFRPRRSPTSAGRRKRIAAHSARLIPAGGGYRRASRFGRQPRRRPRSAYPTRSRCTSLSRKVRNGTPVAHAGSRAK
jgi:hypothetical protein